MLKRLSFAVFILSVFPCASVFAQIPTENATPKTACCGDIEELKLSYFKDNRYNEFVDFFYLLFPFPALGNSRVGLTSPLGRECPCF